MKITDKISPLSIDPKDDFPGFASKCEAAVMAAEIVKEAQIDNKWPIPIHIDKLSELVIENLGAQKYISYTYEAIKVLTDLGYISIFGNSLILQEKFAKDLQKRFPA